MSAIEHLIVDLRCIAAPELPRDRDLALGTIALASKIEDDKEPVLGPLTRMAKSLALALRRGIPAGPASHLYIIAGELAAALAEMPQGYRPPKERKAAEKKPHYTPGVDRD